MQFQGKFKYWLLALTQLKILSIKHLNIIPGFIWVSKMQFQHRTKYWTLVNTSVQWCIMKIMTSFDHSFTYQQCKYQTIIKYHTAFSASTYFASYIKFSIKVWLLILDATTTTIVDSLHITMNCMILHTCCALLFHKMHDRNIGQTFHILLTWPQQARVCRNALHYSHMKLCIKLHDSRFLPSLGATQTVSTV